MGQRFARKVVVVTGASSGIGRATAHAFAREGARVVLGARRKEELEQAAALMRHGGREARAVPCNVTVPGQVARLMEAATSRWDRIDVVVANAGLGLTGEIGSTERDDFRHVMDVNVMGVFNTIQAALPKMIAQGSGTIVIVSSVLGWRGVPLMAGYCASKAALNALSEGLRAELEPKGIKVLLACPGLTRTEFESRRLGTAYPSPVGKWMTAEEVGEAIVDAVASGRKRLVLTRGGRSLVWVNRHFPWLADWLVDRWFARSRDLAVVPPASADGPPHPGDSPAAAS